MRVRVGFRPTIKLIHRVSTMFCRARLASYRASRWTPGLNIQIEGRILRPGQKKTAHVKTFLTQHTGDDMMNKLVGSFRVSPGVRFAIP